MAIYKNTPPVVTNGLVLYLDAANRQSYVSGSTTATDLSGNNLSGSLVNASFNTLNGGAFFISGASSYVNMPLSPLLQFLGTSSYSVEIWANQAVTQSGFPMIGSNENSIGIGRDGVNLTLWMPDSTGVRLFHERFVSNSQAATSVTLPVNSAVGSAFQMVITYDGTNIRTYGNTVSSTLVQSTGSITNTVTTFKLGSRGNGSNNFSGSIYLARTYNRALSQQEVTQNYNATKSRFNLL